MFKKCGVLCFARYGLELIVWEFPFLTPPIPFLLSKIPPSGGQGQGGGVNSKFGTMDLDDMMQLPAKGASFG